LRLAQVSAEIAAAAPVLGAAEDEAQRRAVITRVRESEQALGDLLQALERNGAQAAATELRALATQVSQRIAAVDRAVGERLALAVQRGEMEQQQRTAYERFVAVVVPMTDERNFELTMAIQGLAQETPQTIEAQITQLTEPRPRGVRRRDEGHGRHQPGGRDPQRVYRRAPCAAAGAGARALSSPRSRMSTAPSALADLRESPLKPAPTR
jgi:hypothetical protein